MSISDTIGRSTRWDRMMYSGSSSVLLLDRLLTGGYLRLLSESNATLSRSMKDMGTVQKLLCTSPTLHSSVNVACVLPSELRAHASVWLSSYQEEPNSDMSEHDAVPVHLVAAQPSEPANQPGTMSDDRPIPGIPEPSPATGPRLVAGAMESWKVPQEARNTDAFSRGDFTRWEAWRM
ncbi:hypothetical protein GE21DRAFT_4669 [Neurospora crassa]|uniref:Uncharacterized protein n=1 Tax=Neurospora crassa (strain ATCC 24698 / 74-OR23-1A / CBS 708.71 / DSM 1257 / FGSC 987) TaxID=367110 RepID=Q7RZL2_NEUCR|nr:hypothetical protein NCU00353 [Neurospora crassa OR74A]EAA28588.1 hypothetical protein NCU00353 [Neurospora crassa OR74A]KHE89541.1 hypothetical protein GE21DRAFT_4669 [Neurospora crassa]|eukprot:XP_957824.1 hypothetical protein NCU00353 [Neurospora crassa OR74A]